MRRITVKDCNIQLDFIKTQVLKNSTRVSIKINGVSKNLYQGTELIVSARTYSELYYQLVAFKRGIELGRITKAN